MGPDENTDITPVLAPARPWWFWALVASVGAAVVVAVVALVVLEVVGRSLPALESLEHYRERAKQASVVYGAGGEVIGRFAEERRTLVSYEQIPQAMKDAVVAAEDSDFFTHGGVDLSGILRCVVKNALSGRKRCGGSTITQQMVKTFLLSSEKTYIRKLKEIVLAKRVEDQRSKDEILELYLNQIYFGQGAYGVQEAARVYFGKDAKDLGLEEAALLAGLPQAPSRLSPFSNPDGALRRRSYVLKRMLETEKIDAEAHQRADAAPLPSAPNDPHPDRASYFLAQVRRDLEDALLHQRPLAERLGYREGDGRTPAEVLLLTGGLSIQTGLDLETQAAAEDAVEKGLTALDRRQGWRGPLFRLEPPAVRALEEALAARSPKDEPVASAWDLGLGAMNEREDVSARAHRRPLATGADFVGWVTEVDDPAGHATVGLGDVQVRLPLSGMAWARPFDLGRITARPGRPSDVLSPGDVVLVTLEKANEDGSWRGTLSQRPAAQAAVVVLDPTSRAVRALVGGSGSGAAGFNRAVQARRQAGSTFKPVVYAAAFASREFTTVSRCLDAPRTYRDPWTEKTWRPQNYGRSFDGDISFRTALTFSKNTCSVELVDKLGVDPVLKMAQQLGLQGPLPRNLTLALGTAEVSPLEMTNAYATLADGGRWRAPVVVQRVLRNGEVLFEREDAERAALEPGVAYLLTSLMTSVVEEGTAKAVRQLDREIAGKTGTTNDARDAWFIGYTPNLVAGVWVGFDDNRPLGPGETGGRAAIPIWLSTMGPALRDKPREEFAAPGDVVMTTVDPETGRLAPSKHPGARDEPFLAGTEPTTVVESERPAERGLWDDYE